MREGQTQRMKANDPSTYSFVFVNWDASPEGARKDVYQTSKMTGLIGKRY